MQVQKIRSFFSFFAILPEFYGYKSILVNHLSDMTRLLLYILNVAIIDTFEACVLGPKCGKATVSGP